MLLAKLHKNKIVSVCPKSCHKVIEKCTSNDKCNKTWQNYITGCSEVTRWNGNSTQPTCTNTCKRLINELVSNPISRSLKCCVCDERDKEDRMSCALKRQNIERVCKVKLSSSDECQKNKKECNDTRRKENNVDRRGKIYYLDSYRLSYQL